MEPHSEGDPAALLLGFLVAMGAVLGRSVHLPIGATRHFPNLFAVIVAPSGKGRKGTVMAEISRFVELADPTFESRIASGLSSGEGLIEAVRDPLEADVPIKENGTIRHERQTVDNGIEDKRLLAAEGEMAQPLQAASRDGNTLSAILRQAWDGTPLRVLARSNKNACKEPHISILGNITAETPFAGSGLPCCMILAGAGLMYVASFFVLLCTAALVQFSTPELPNANRFLVSAFQTGQTPGSRTNASIFHIRLVRNHPSADTDEMPLKSRNGQTVTLPVEKSSVFDQIGVTSAVVVKDKATGRRIASRGRAVSVSRKSRSRTFLRGSQ